MYTVQPNFLINCISGMCVESKDSQTPSCLPETKHVFWAQLVVVILHYGTAEIRFSRVLASRSARCSRLDDLLHQWTVDALIHLATDRVSCVKNRLSNHGSATKSQQLRLSNYGSETTPQQLKSPLQQLRFSNYASETSPQQPKPVLASETSLQQLRFSNQTLRMRNQTPTCNFLIFKSTPSPCYTHVKSRCTLLILNPPPLNWLRICQVSVSMCTS